MSVIKASGPRWAGLLLHNIVPNSNDKTLHFPWGAHGLGRERERQITVGEGGNIDGCKGVSLREGARMG